MADEDSVGGWLPARELSDRARNQARMLSGNALGRQSRSLGSAPTNGVSLGELRPRVCLRRYPGPCASPIASREPGMALKHGPQELVVNAPRVGVRGADLAAQIFPMRHWTDKTQFWLQEK